MNEEIERDVRFAGRVHAERLRWLADLVIEAPLGGQFCEIARGAMRPVFSLLEKVGYEPPFTPLVTAEPRPILERVSRVSVWRWWWIVAWRRLTRGRARKFNGGQLPLELAARR